ncbi:MAG: hypothetical protein ACE5K0_04915 [Candidatus Methanofastidiosia archaeon]
MLSSPIYMPFAWMEVIPTHGYIILRLRERFSEKVSAFLGALIAGLTIGFYETIAYHAKWWMYLKASFFIFNTPLFIPLALWYSLHGTF